MSSQSAKLQRHGDMTQADQKKINAFANANATFQDIKEEIETKKKEIQNLTDADTDVMMLDDGVTVPFQMGEAFICVGQEEAASMMEAAKEAAEARLVVLQGQQDAVQETMKKLKVDLYAKFGDNINLESEE